MADRSPTIAETIDEIRASLRDYIEASYHVSSPRLVRQRRELLEQVGVTFQIPYLESTPRYKSGDRFADLGLPPAATEMFAVMSDRAAGKPLLFDPPYRHQAEALKHVLQDRRSLVVTTGTGSGKTESFLLPMFGKLAIEAQQRPESFRYPAVRAILLYPMNALVNDQLGRLRLLLGDSRVSGKFVQWAGRPARFARYTSRTLYPGVRTAKKDGERLRPLGSFYAGLIEAAEGDPAPVQVQAAALMANLQTRGKWPAKPDLRTWFGRENSRWQNNDGEFVRAVTLAGDPELLTRHEVLAAPPDVLVTNYSMLEYMLMRPLERPIFDATHAWLEAHPNESLLLVVDEAHLYRGAAGAEVGLLIRRLRARLGVQPDRLQVICTSASFNSPDNARVFAGQLTGKSARDFATVEGDLAMRPHEARGTEQDAQALASISMEAFYGAKDQAAQLASVEGFVRYRGTEASSLERSLYNALVGFGPMSLLINLTMREARPLKELGSLIFDVPDRELADRALTTLIAFGSVARPADDEPGLLPCRIHTFFRGLPGLWACADADCPAAQHSEEVGPVGHLFGQPRDQCDCGARVFEVFTCRHCGAAYARAYTDDLESPSYLWSEPGGRFQSVNGPVNELHPIDLCFERPIPEGVEPAELDLITGRLNPNTPEGRTRRVFLKLDRTGTGEERGARDLAPGEFKPCGVCGKTSSGRTSVQPHLTRGDQPFQALVTRQLEVQPPSRAAKSEFAPLQGRKVLAFSDSRQTAARLAPNLQTYSMQDVLRPLVLVGFKELSLVPGFARSLSLEDLYLAVLLSAAKLGVRLRPELRAGESLHAQRLVESAVHRGDLEDPAAMLDLLRTVSHEVPPQSLLRGLVTTITDKYYGLQSLALASVVEREGLQPELLAGLPPLGSIASEPEDRLALARLWLNQWLEPGIWFQGMTTDWWQTSRGVRGHSGKFAALTRWLGDAPSRRAFETTWLPVLLRQFCEPTSPGKYRIKAGALTLRMDGSWGYCQACRTTQRPLQSSATCIGCGRGEVKIIDPDVDPVFVARKSYYRATSVRAMGNPAIAPMAIIAAEHTAQLGAAQADEIFSKAEEHELLFQDVDLGPSATGLPRTAIDVLSCTTTMEVGIDIGTLSGVALRNMPPSRASYQQRAGRAGRRGNAVATVIAFGSSDSHDEHYFSEPDAMIRSRVDDPMLTLDNEEIAARHVTAFLLQRYHQERLPSIDPADQPQLFEVLGKVRDFRQAGSVLSRVGFEAWLRKNEPALASEVDGWLPAELTGDARRLLLTEMVDRTLRGIDSALQDRGVIDEPAAEAEEEPSGDAEGRALEAQAEVGEEHDDPSKAAENLLDRLLYKGVLPRYAFPTDVVAFHVFDRDRYTRYRPVFRYAPSQGLPVALSQYAPGKEVWIDGKLWTSGALYSPMKDDLYFAWEARSLYFECTTCHYAKTEPAGEAVRGDLRDCPACGGTDTFGRAVNWMRPPGFAHPQLTEEGTTPDDQPDKSLATRAKLVAPGPADASRWQTVTPRIRAAAARDHLLVTNTGPRREGYTYCTRCGLIEPTAAGQGSVSSPHPKPYPDLKQPECPGTGATRGLVLGTDFISDVLLISLSVDAPLTLTPGYLSTDVALRTLCEALTIEATSRLEIEPGELQAEYRPALTPGGRGREGLEAEIYLYDTLAGGAGFARRVGDLGVAVFEGTLRRLESCPADCDRSCYRCLRSFKNRFEHDLLDRHVGASLLRYLLHEEEPALSPKKITQAAERVAADVSRQGIDGLRLTRDASVDLPGIGTLIIPILAELGGRRLLIGIHGPLTPDFAPDPALRDAKEFGGAVPVLLLDELVVARNLPHASRQIRDAMK